MITKIIKWFSPVEIMGNEEKEFRFRVLQRFIVFVLGFTILVVILNLTDPNTPIENYFIDLLIILLLLGLNYLLHKGWVDFVSIVQIITSFFVSLLLVRAEGTVLAPATVSFLVTIVLSGVQFGNLGVAVSSLVSSIAIGGFIYVEQSHLLTIIPHFANYKDWLVYTLFFGLVGILTAFSQNLTKNSLKKANDELVSRKLTEEELRKLNRAVEQSPVSIMITDLQGNIEYVNPRFTQNTGYSTEEVIGKTPRLLKSSSTPRETYANLWQTIENGKEWFGELTNQRKDGTLYTESKKITQITNSQGEVTHYLALNEDITEKKRIENELIESSRSLEKLNDQLNTRIGEVQQLQDKLHRMAMHDSLTGLYNRNFLETIIGGEMERSDRYDVPLSMAVLDIDHFKYINDAWGHPVGDEVLQQIADMMRSVIREADILVRLGGEEFAILMPLTTEEEAFLAGSKLRETIEKAVFPIIGHLTISVGIAGRKGNETFSQWYKRADDALYQAKQSGRNKVVIWFEES